MASRQRPSEQTQQQRQQQQQTQERPAPAPHNRIPSKEGALAKKGPRAPVPIVGGKYEIEKKLGACCFGEVWRGSIQGTREQVAVKFEDEATRSPQLDLEAEILRLLARPVPQEGFCEVHYAAREGRWRCLVMDLLGASLEDRLQASQGARLTLSSVVLIAEQVLRRIEYLHSKCIVHRDIKPENFVFGVGERVHHLFMIDFGLSKRYHNRDKHAPMRKGLNLTGTARYASINTHRGFEQSRRDDLEAIGHMLIYFVRGSLPWSGLQACTQEEKYRKIKERKQATALEDLCKGHPDAFMVYLRTARALQFKERPDYRALRQHFRDVRERHGPAEDYDYPWLSSEDVRGLAPLSAWDGVRQPDDPEMQVAKRWSFCPYACGGGTL